MMSTLYIDGPPIKATWLSGQDATSYLLSKGPEQFLVPSSYFQGLLGVAGVLCVHEGSLPVADDHSGVCIEAACTQADTLCSSATYLLAEAKRGSCCGQQPVVDVDRSFIVGIYSKPFLDSVTLKIRKKLVLTRRMLFLLYAESGVNSNEPGLVVF